MTEPISNTHHNGSRATCHNTAGLMKYVREGMSAHVSDLTAENMSEHTLAFRVRLYIQLVYPESFAGTGSAIVCNDLTCL